MMKRRRRRMRRRKRRRVERRSRRPSPDFPHHFPTAPLPRPIPNLFHFLLGSSPVRGP